jgi:hypothetical protein
MTALWRGERNGLRGSSTNLVDSTDPFRPTRPRRAE